MDVSIEVYVGVLDCFHMVVFLEPPLIRNQCSQVKVLCT